MLRHVGNALYAIVLFLILFGFVLILIGVVALAINGTLLGPQPIEKYEVLVTDKYWQRASAGKTFTNVYYIVADGEWSVSKEDFERVKVGDYITFTGRQAGIITTASAWNIQILGRKE